MTLVSAHIEQLDPYDARQIANGSAWCQRLAATLSVAACMQNQEHTRLDCRCTGCGGLNNQTPPPQAAPDLSLNDKAINSLSALDEIIDGLYEDPAPGDDFDDVELDLDDEMLLALFPELADDPSPDFPRFSEYQTEAPRRAVYRGRCIKCWGYMENTRERQDDNVFRCLACGWRTSPDYEHNRAIHRAGGR